MPRSRRAKSQSVSSINADTVLNGSMPPPSPPSPALPAKTGSLTRRRVPSSTVKTKSPAAPLLSHTTVTTPSRVSKIPPSAQFLVVVLSVFLLEAGLQTAASTFGAGDLAAISKRAEDWTDITALLGWKVFTLAIYWYGGFDAVDVASLSILLQTPIAILYHFFYLVHPTTIILSTAASIAATAIPFYALRPISGFHDVAHSSPKTIRNRTIIIDPVTTFATSTIADLVFAAMLQISFSTFLPSWLITHFAGLRTLEFVYAISTTLPTLIAWLLPAGFASTQFLFKPSEGVINAHHRAVAPFDPITSTFAQHVYYNLWGWYTGRQKELIGRTFILGSLVLAETLIHVWGTIKGVEIQGAAGYGAVWAAAVVVIGMALDWVGRPSD